MQHDVWRYAVKQKHNLRQCIRASVSEADWVERWRWTRVRSLTEQREFRFACLIRFIQFKFSCVWDWIIFFGKDFWFFISFHFIRLKQNGKINRNWPKKYMNFSYNEHARHYWRVASTAVTIFACNIEIDIHSHIDNIGFSLLNNSWKQQLPPIHSCCFALFTFRCFSSEAKWLENHPIWKSLARRGKWKMTSNQYRRAM